MNEAPAPEQGSGTAPTRESLALRRGLVILPWRNALIIEGGARRRLVKGTALASILPILPHLVPLLDGRHSREDICADFGLTRAVLDEFLASLAQCGVLERACHMPSAAAQAAPQAACYLSRTATALDDGCRSGAEIAALLADSAVLVVAPSAVGKPIAADLAETGVGSVIVADSVSEVPAAGIQALASAAQGFAAVLDDGAAGSGRDHLAECISRGHEYGVPVLRFACRTDALEVGPTFHPSHPACAACFRRSYGRVVWPEAGAREPVGASPHGDEFGIQAVLTALVTSELLAHLGALGPTAAPRRLVRITARGYESEQYDLAPEPDCPSCGAGRSPDSAAETAATFEWLEGTEPTRSARWLPMRSPSELRAAVPLLGTLTDMGWAPRIALDDERLNRADSAIAEIVTAFAGWRPAVKPGAAPRFEPDDNAPSAIHAYVLADGDRTDLPATIYKYDGVARQLVGVRSDPVSLTRALHATDLDPSAIGFAVVLVAAVAHMQYQHGTSALRLSHLDAGCAATQIANAAGARGRGISFASTWPKELADLLELHATEEVIAAIAGIDRQPEERASCR